MNKTLHQKLSDKQQYTYPIHIEMLGSDDLSTDFSQEYRLLREDAQNLLSPRPEAISGILEMSRMVPRT